MTEDVEARLARMRKAMAKMTAEGREREFDALDKAYQVLQRERDEQEAARLRAARVEVRRVAAVRPSEPSRRWRLPRGFGTSPLAAQRAREGRPDVPVVPDSRRRALSPWRRYGGSMSEQIWRPPA